MKKFLLSAMALSFAFALHLPAYANDETVGEKVQEAASDAGKNIKKGARAVKDKTCHLVNGKMQCAAQKLKHKAQNAGDEISDKVDDIKK